MVQNGDTCDAIVNAMGIDKTTLLANNQNLDSGCSFIYAGEVIFCPFNLYMDIKLIGDHIGSLRRQLRCLLQHCRYSNQKTLSHISLSSQASNPALNKNILWSYNFLVKNCRHVRIHIIQNTYRRFMCKLVLLAVMNGKRVVSTGHMHQKFWRY